MSVQRKSRQPANDEAHSLQRMSFVTLPPPRMSRAKKATAVAAIGVFLAVSVATVISFLPRRSEVTPLIATAPTVATAQPSQQPYDISLDASALAPPDEVAQVAARLPADIVTPQKSFQRALPPVMTIDVGDRVAMTVPQNSIPEHAKDQAELARRLMKQGDLQQAITIQNRAVAQDPANARLRLELAIMYDKAADRQQAAANYNRVLRAYDAHDESLPLGFNVAEVSRRLAWLQAQATQPSDPQ